MITALYNGWNTGDGSIQRDWAANGATKYYSYLAHGGAPLTQDPGGVALQGQVANEKYQQQVGTAISGLQTQKSGLAQQYADLLTTVKGEYQPLIDQTTATAGAALANRGLTPDSQLYQQQTQGALAPVYGQEAGNAQQIGAGSISDTNTLAQAIAGLQSGAALNTAQLPLSYGSLAQNASLIPSQIAGNTSQANYYGGLNANNLALAQLQYGEPFAVQSGVVFNPSSGQFKQATGGGASPDMMTMAKTISANSVSKRPSAQGISQYVNS